MIKQGGSKTSILGKRSTNLLQVDSLKPFCDGFKLQSKQEGWHLFKAEKWKAFDEVDVFWLIKSCLPGSSNENQYFYSHQFE